MTGRPTVWPLMRPNGEGRRGYRSEANYPAISESELRIEVRLIAAVVVFHWRVVFGGRRDITLIKISLACLLTEKLI